MITGQPSTMAVPAHRWPVKGCHASEGCTPHSSCLLFFQPLSLTIPAPCTPLQGIRREAGDSGRSCYVLTDPALCSADGLRRYGTTDIGDRAVQAFMQDHKCTAMCHRVPPSRAVGPGV